MESQDKIENQFKSIIEVFKKGGCSKSETLSFINTNIDFLIENENNFLENIYFIYNNNDLYGALIVNDNNYSWSIYKEQEFYPIRQNIDNNFDPSNGDYIVEMILNFSNKNSIKEIVPNIENMPIATKVKKLKQIKFNSNGYHLR